MAGFEDRAPSLSRATRLQQFCSGPVLDVAPALLGAVIEHRSVAGTVAVRLTEVEAYAGPGDPGSHARHGRTARTAVMFGPPAHLYVYFSYGMHWCVNVICAPEGAASAVLLRAGEVVDGLQLARARRPAARRDRDLARGPARLASALGLDGALNGAEVGGPLSAAPVRLRLRPAPMSPRGVTGPDVGSVTGPPEVVRTGPRVGVSGPGGDGAVYPWRFWLDGDPTVSQYRPGAVSTKGHK